MRYPKRTDRQRMEIAEVAGHASRLGVGDLRDVPRDQAVGQLWQISTDPVVFGDVLAGALENGPTAVAELLRAAGADEAAAAEKLEWLRWDLEQKRLGRFATEL
jgi:hypothetical protein